MLIRKTPLKRTAMRRSARKAAPSAEKAHLGRVAAMPCLVCGSQANVHHITSDGFQRITRNHRRVVPLCRICHQDGPGAVHKIGHRAFCELHGDILVLADRLWSENNC